MTPQPMETAPKDRPILVYGIWDWGMLCPDGIPGWRVAKWENEMDWDEDGNPIGGWKSITCNPYKDYGIAEKWAELPA